MLFSRMTSRRIHEQERVAISKPGQKLLWCPFAQRIVGGLPSRGRYQQGYPRGAVVHYTAGTNAASAIDALRQAGCSAFVIERDGTILQPHGLDGWSWHAGVSFWNALGSGVSRHLVGIEVVSAGKLTGHRPSLKSDMEWKSWWGGKIPSEQVRTSPERGNIAPGGYQKFTEAQEDSLVALLLWLKANNPEVFSLNLVLGHDEVSPGRKTDPGASLSASMEEFREFLHAEFDASRQEVSLV